MFQLLADFANNGHMMEGLHEGSCGGMIWGIIPLALSIWFIVFSIMALVKLNRIESKLKK